MVNSKNNKPLLGRARYILCIALFFFFLIPQFLNAYDIRGFNFVNNKTQTSIPFKLVDNLIVFPVTINNDFKLNMVLDTGDRSIILFGNKFRKKLKMMSKEIALHGYGEGGGRVARISIDNHVKISEVEGNGIAIVVTADRNLFPFHRDFKIDGIIGYQIFGRFVVKIDYHNSIITLSEPSMFEADAGYEVLPLKVKGTKPYIPADLRLPNQTNNQGYFHVDTGSSRELILFLEDGVEPDEDVRIARKKVGKGLNGTIRGYAVLKQVRFNFGNNQWEKIETHYVNKPQSDRELAGAVGSLGSGFLKDYTIVMDYINGRFYYKRSNW